MSGKNTGNLGVVEEAIIDGSGPLRFTNLERTLIDMRCDLFMRGVFEVRKAYQLAREKISIEKLAGFLRKLAFIYPYHQAIGYYLERAGVEAAQLEVLRRLPMDFNFYLTHQMSQTEFVDRWRLFVPKGF